MSRATVAVLVLLALAVGAALAFGDEPPREDEDGDLRDCA